MLKRRRLKHTETFYDRLTSFAKDAREQAASLPPGQEREDLLKKARQADTACYLDEWANSRGLMPPK